MYNNSKNLFTVEKKSNPTDNNSDGNTITIDKQNIKAFITFSIGRGDCMSGCIYHRYWQFVVENNIAKFVKSWDWY
ncbi:MAG: hypothetical protein R6T91_00225 [Bacteroidales bacterium]